jgi:hypothetical protein
MPLEPALNLKGTGFHVEPERAKKAVAIKQPA